LLGPREIVVKAVDYTAPKTISEACAALAGKATRLAAWLGAPTSSSRSARAARSGSFVDIKFVPEVNELSYDASAASAGVGGAVLSDL